MIAPDELRRLALATPRAVESAPLDAWRDVAPKELLEPRA
jgi:hypothetical protein